MSEVIVKPNKAIGKPPVPFVLKELVNYDKVIEIFKSNLMEDMSKERSQIDWKTEDFKILFEYYKNDGCVERQYLPKEDCPLGRQFTKNGLGLQHLSKELRGYLCQDDYLDIDISSCSASILYEFMRTDKFDCPLMKEYINNKVDWRKNYPGIKDLINEQINDRKNLRKTEWQKPNDLLKKIQEYIRKRFTSEDKAEMYKAITKVERSYVDKILKICQSAQVRVNALIFDGMIIEKIDNADELVKEINKRIYPMRVEIKEWDLPKIKIMNTQKFDFLDPLVFNHFLNLSGNNYISEHHFYLKSVPYLLKTARYISELLLTKVVLTKTGDSFKMYKKPNLIDFSVTYEETKHIHISVVLKIFRRLIAFDKMTPIRFNLQPHEFSTDCGFLTDGHPLPDDWEKRTERFKKHVLEICSNNSAEIANGFYYWYANLIQTDKKSQHMMITTGQGGAGKSIIPTMLIENILGSKGLIFAKLCDVTKKFNALLSGKRLVLTNEISNYDPNAKNQKPLDIDELKNKIDAPYFSLERKGIDEIQLPNILEFYGCSNNKYCIPQLDGVERRNFIIEVDNKLVRNKKYFVDFVAYFEDKDNARSIFEFLNTYDIRDYSTLENLPKTESKLVGIFRSMNIANKALAIACRLDMETRDIIDADGNMTKEKFMKDEVVIKRSDLFKIMKKYNLIKKPEYNVNKMTSYISDFVNKKIIIKTTDHANARSYHINPAEIRYDTQMWNIFDEFIGDNSISTCEMHECTEDKHYCGNPEFNNV